jgi:hypothetical protein
MVMHAESTQNRITIYNSYPYKEIIKQIQGRYWNADSRTWTIPCSEENLKILQGTGCGFDKTLSEMIEAMDRDKALTGSRSNPLQPMPIKGVPYLHQIEAFNMACTTLGIIKGGVIHG